MRIVQSRGDGDVVSIPLADDMLAAFNVVYHPDAYFSRPFQEAGLAIRLWPDPPSALDLASRPRFSRIGYDQLRHLFVTGGPTISLPPDTIEHLHPFPDGDSWPGLCLQSRPSTSHSVDNSDS